MTSPTSIHDLPTPALLVDLDALERNLERMQARCDALGVALRPHVKTHKCIEIGYMQRERGARGITVSTLEEARAFADAGFDDITWAFPVIPGRIGEARAIAERSTLRLVLDSRAAVEALERDGFPFHVWLEVDSGDHRSGVEPASDAAQELARALADSASLLFDGILTHAGHTYRAPDEAGRRAVAGEERDVMVELANRLRDAGLEVRGVSVGSTPGMTAVDHLRGLTEARPGNYAYFDATQVALGACEARDCALTVWASVVSSARDHAVVDAGALALSKDAGPAGERPSMGRLFAEHEAGRLRDERLVSLSQEHGVVGGPLEVGSRVRILPNHSCLTNACFDRVHAVRGESVVDVWRVRRKR
ncbi:MAG TPA: alanine racemase [Gemmatimonadota bacterium]|nr:alanine racemase [Gemmatimonadota bacterium]